MDMIMIERLLRQVLQFAAGALVSHGVITQGAGETAVGIIAAAIIAGWVAYRNSKPAMISAVAKLPEVSVVATTPALAQAIPDPAVVSVEAVKVAGRSLSAHGWLGALLVMTIALAGCATIDRADATLSRLSRGSLPAACAIVGVAQGYFDTLAPRISAANHARYAAASLVVSRVCAERPADTASAMVTLARAWADIQAATKAR